MCFEIHLFSSCYHFTDKEMAATKEKFCLQVPHTLNGEAEIPTQECLTLNPSSIHDSRSDHTWPRCHRPSNISKLNSPYHKWHSCERDTRVLSFLEIFLSPRQTALINTGPLLPARMQLCQYQPARALLAIPRPHSAVLCPKDPETREMEAEGNGCDVESDPPGNAILSNHVFK